MQVYALEKVLNTKTDATSQKPFLDEVMKVLENKPSAIFWTVVSRSIEKHSIDAGKSKSYVGFHNFQMPMLTFCSPRLEFPSTNPWSRLSASLASISRVLRKDCFAYRYVI